MIKVENKKRLEVLRGKNNDVGLTGAELAEFELLEAGKDPQGPVDVVIPTPINAAGPEVKIQGGKTNVLEAAEVIDPKTASVPVEVMNTTKTDKPVFVEEVK